MRIPLSEGEDKDRAMQRKAIRRIIVLSLLLHVLFLASWNAVIGFAPAQLLPAAPAAKGAPLVFDLQRPDLPREVIATPADAPTAPRPRRADFLSDKNALARNQEPAPHLPLREEPFARGDLASHDLATRPPSPERPAARTQEPGQGRAVARGEGNSPQAGGSDLPEGERAEAEAGPHEPSAGGPAGKPFRFDLPGVLHRQMEARADRDGGLSFNTYNWDFAPYMLALKERISRNIFPPLAFSKLGMIDGNTLLRFKIYPDGRLADLELLGYSGHRSLMETSRLAVSASAPFPSLPADFPESYLEVTAKFSYFIKK
jgi:outer membrane biosynthesis protein TonB